MPVRVERRGDKWRVVESETGKIAKTSKGKPVDGGGHQSESMAKAQVRAINANKGG